MQSNSVAAEVTCIESAGKRMVFVPCSEDAPKRLKIGAPTRFQFSDRSGIVRLSGTLENWTEVVIDGIAQQALAMAVDPQSVGVSNRREHYRVAASLKGEFTEISQAEESLTSGSDVSSREELSGSDRPGRQTADRKRPCIVRDLSLGGARLSVPSPPPPTASKVVLDIALGPGDVLRKLLCTVVEGITGAGPAPFDAQLRVRFHQLSPRDESRLSRQITRMQFEMLRRGIRS